MKLEKGMKAVVLGTSGSTREKYRKGQVVTVEDPDYDGRCFVVDVGGRGSAEDFFCANELKPLFNVGDLITSTGLYTPKNFIIGVIEEVDYKAIEKGEQLWYRVAKSFGKGSEWVRGASAVLVKEEPVPEFFKKDTLVYGKVYGINSRVIGKIDKIDLEDDLGATYRVKVIAPTNEFKKMAERFEENEHDYLCWLSDKSIKPLPESVPIDEIENHWEEYMEALEYQQMAAKRRDRSYKKYTEDDLKLGDANDELQIATEDLEEVVQEYNID